MTIDELKPAVEKAVQKIKDQQGHIDNLTAQVTALQANVADPVKVAIIANELNAASA